VKPTDRGSLSFGRRYYEPLLICFYIASCGKIYIAQGVALQSFKVTQGHHNWYQPQPICDFLLAFHCNYMPCLTSISSRYNDLLVENLCSFAVFTHTSLVWRPSKGFTCDLADESWHQKTTECMGERRWTPHDLMVHQFDTLPTTVTDRRTDWRTKRHRSLQSVMCR